MDTADNQNNQETIDGYVKEMSNWSRELAKELAARNDIGPLTDDHWKVIEHIKEYYQDYHQGPPILKLCRDTGFTRKYICELFPCGYVRGAFRLAGLPRPAGCI
ncbi:sulfurtransferase TusE [candidate division LCP-89 bacterium B3_LCP]|uniref:Sulfurtransferase TusE n=1 Tax=candidate division LCP-89 bacterium B3_LCP TaxID=2012998 RepID=A0A532UUA4_UNCL8|nr:MAG: sulfurtransferase TusE [candidate division LCP-89 bacterium B3_LCP]